jgi:hypothetical protein
MAKIHVTVTFLAGGLLTNVRLANGLGLRDDLQAVRPQHGPRTA